MKKILVFAFLILPIVTSLAQEVASNGADDAFAPSLWMDLPLIEKITLTENLLNLARPLSENELRFLESLESDAESGDNALVNTTATSYILLIREQQGLLDWEARQQSIYQRQQDIAQQQDDLKFNGFWVDVSTYSVLGVGIASLATSLVFSFLSQDAYVRYATTDQNLPRSSLLQEEYSRYELLSYGFAGGAILAAISYVSLEMARQ